MLVVTKKLVGADSNQRRREVNSPVALPLAYTPINYKATDGNRPRMPEPQFWCSAHSPAVCTELIKHFSQRCLLTERAQDFPSLETDRTLDVIHYIKRVSVYNIQLGYHDHSPGPSSKDKS